MKGLQPGSCWALERTPRPQQDVGEPKGKDRSEQYGRRAGRALSTCAQRGSRALPLPAPPSVTLTRRSGNAHDYLRDSSVCVKAAVTDRGLCFNWRWQQAAFADLRPLMPALCSIPTGSTSEDSVSYGVKILPKTTALALNIYGPSSLVILS